MKCQLDRPFRTGYLASPWGKPGTHHQEEFIKPAERVLVILATAMVVTVFSSTMLGQSGDATLLGTVTDSTGAVVAGAKASARCDRPPC